MFKTPSPSLSHVLASLRLDTKKTAKVVGTWDEAVPTDLGEKLVKNVLFWIEDLASREQ